MEEIPQVVGAFGHVQFELWYIRVFREHCPAYQSE